jgi:hypothetical protein
MALNILIVDDSILTRKKIRRIIEMVQRMRRNEATKSVPVVVVSTESKTTRVKELLAEGVKDYLHKPFTPEQFRNIIQAVWNRPVIETKNVSEALTDALEVMAFLTVMPMEDDLGIPDETILAEIEFMGAKNGSVQIIAGLGFGRILAENIGNVDNPGKEEVYDAIKELSNVTCGLFLPMLTSTTAESFTITVPRIQTCDNSSHWHEFVADQNSVVSNVEGHMVATRPSSLLKSCLKANALICCSGLRTGSVRRLTV